MQKLSPPKVPQNWCSKFSCGVPKEIVDRRQGVIWWLEDDIWCYCKIDKFDKGSKSEV